MAIVTLNTLNALGAPDLAVGIAETIVTVNPLFAVLPYNLTQGTSYAWNVEGVAGTVAAGGRGASTAGAKAQMTAVPMSEKLITIAGDVEIAGLDDAAGSGTDNDMEALQVASKAKSLGREYQRLMILGNRSTPASSNITGVANAEEFDGLQRIFARAEFAEQDFDKGGDALTLEHLDEALFAVLAGEADFIMAPGAAVRKILSLMRASGGVTMLELQGVQVPMWNGKPIFRNDFIPVAAGVTEIYAACFDDGSRKLGLSGVMPEGGGFAVRDVGWKDDSDVFVKRVVQYTSMAVHNAKSIARLKNVLV